MKKISLLFLLLLPACLCAFDFGAAFTQDLGVSGISDNTDVDYTGGFIPFFSTSFGDSGDFYISAWIKVVYEYEKTNFVGEILHAEYTWRYKDYKIKAGRIPYAAPLDFLAEGYFDGAQAFCDTKFGTFNAGGWYTGLLYKKTANITMTPGDLLSYYTPLDYDDFPNTYFASRRMLMSVGWEYPDIAGMISGKAGLLGQLDLNKDDENQTTYNSVYLSAKAAMPIKQFIVTTGLCIQTAKDFDDKTGIGLAGELGGSWITPTPFFSQLSLTGRYSSGKNNSIISFIPVTTKPQGSVLQAKLSGISALFLDYDAKLYPNVSAGLSASYFVRNGKETNNDIVMIPIDGGGSALGCELFGRAAWNPFTDLSVNFGAGVFLPSLGNAAPDAGTQWRLELGFMLVVY